LKSIRSWAKKHRGDTKENGEFIHGFSPENLYAQEIIIWQINNML